MSDFEVYKYKNVEVAEKISIYPKTPYPTLKVTLVYMLLGGLVGGFVLGLGFFIFLLFDGKFKIAAILIFPFFGFFVGLIPALITGGILSALKVTRENHLAHFVGAGVSAVSVVIAILVLALINYKGELLENVVIILVIAVIGYVSSFIVGKLVLPDESIDIK